MPTLQTWQPGSSRPSRGPWAAIRGPVRDGVVPAGLGSFLLGLLFLTPVSATAGPVPDFHAFLSPDLVCDVDLGEIVELHFDVDETAVQFNGYEVTIQFDPDLLQFIEVLEGSLFTDACATTFESFVMTDSTVTYTHVTLCDGLSLSGPGRLSTFRFATVAIGLTEVEIVSDPDRTFVDAGLWVWPMHPTFPRQVVFDNAVVIILDPDPAGTPPVDMSERPLRIEPHPVGQNSEIFFVSSTSESALVDLVDVAGRRIWSARIRSGTGLRRIPFPQQDQEGKRIEAGIYFVSVRQTGQPRQLQKVIVPR